MFLQPDLSFMPVFPNFYFVSLLLKVETKLIYVFKLLENFFIVYSLILKSAQVAKNEMKNLQ